jgi:hypothetical protein
MKDEKSFENRICDFFRARQAEIRTTPQLDERVLGCAARAQQDYSGDSKVRRLHRYRGTVGIVAAGVIIFAGVLVLWLSQRVVMPVYAAEIIQAIRKIETVHRLPRPLERDGGSAYHL